jgi:hypothetical protein
MGVDACKHLRGSRGAPAVSPPHSSQRVVSPQTQGKRAAAASTPQPAKKQKKQDLKVPASAPAKVQQQHAAGGGSAGEGWLQAAA